MGTHHPEHHIKWGVGLFSDSDVHPYLQGLGEIFGLPGGLGESHPCLAGQTRRGSHICPIHGPIFDLSSESDSPDP
jgi:hypothetical protein